MKRLAIVFSLIAMISTLQQLFTPRNGTRIVQVSAKMPKVISRFRGFVSAQIESWASRAFNRGQALIH